jgi:quercetin dioxygenase-like cupin family protein
MSDAGAKEMPRVIDRNSVMWQPHPRFEGVFIKALLTPADNTLANVTMVSVPPDAVVGRHRHPTQVETVFLLEGTAVLTLDETNVQLHPGQIVAIPIGMEHALRNAGTTTVELLAFFTPPVG